MDNLDNTPTLEEVIVRELKRGVERLADTAGQELAQAIRVRSQAIIDELTVDPPEEADTTVRLDLIAEYHKKVTCLQAVVLDMIAQVATGDLPVDIGRHGYSLDTQVSYTLDGFPTRLAKRLLADGQIKTLGELGQIPKVKLFRMQDVGRVTFAELKRFYQYNSLKYHSSW